jgi:hypothetical protein
MNNKKWITISFYTPDNAYAKVFNERLGRSLKEIPDIPNKIYQVSSRGSWLNNIAIKPEIIKRAMFETQKNILWVDADAMFTTYPKLMDTVPDNCDLMYHTLDHSVWYGTNTNRMEIFNGTIYLRNNVKTHVLLDEWIARCAINPRLGEHRHFESLVMDSRDIVTYDLPHQYAYITSLPNGDKPRVEVVDPIICHYQASRQHRKTQL